MNLIGLLRTTAAGAVLAAALPLSLLTAAPASAAETDGMLLSYDGVTFSPVPQGSLFPSGVQLSPGSSATGTLHVRNATEVPAELRLAVTGATASTVSFLESLSMAASTPTTPVGTPISLASGTTCTALLAGERLQPGATAVLTISLGMASESGNDAQGSSAGTTLNVSLRESGAPDLAGSDCDAGAEIPVEVGDGDGDDTTSGGNSGAGGSTAGRGSATDAPTPSPTPSSAPAPGTGTGSSAPEVGTPAVSGLPQTGWGISPAVYPWLGVVALVTGMVVFFLLRNRGKQEE